jgi:hypothetical protein
MPKNEANIAMFAKSFRKKTYVKIVGNLKNCVTV